jgi:hypothetical protein
MPWLIQHKCSMDGSVVPYAIIKTQVNGRPVTKVVCEKPDCRESFIIEGVEMFGEATRQELVNPNLPPGFLLPRSYKRDS